MSPGTCGFCWPSSPSSTSAGNRPRIFGPAVPTRADPTTAAYNVTIAKSDILQGKRAKADEAFVRVLREAVETVERAGHPFLVLGGLASSLVGRPRWTHDIDFLVRPDDARDVLVVLRSAGFTTEETDPVWIYKAFKDNVMVDIIFMVMGGIYLDDEMRARSIERDYIPSPSGGGQGGGVL